MIHIYKFSWHHFSFLREMIPFPPHACLHWFVKKSCFPFPLAVLAHGDLLQVQELVNRKPSVVAFHKRVRLVFTFRWLDTSPVGNLARLVHFLVHWFKKAIIWLRSRYLSAPIYGHRLVTKSLSLEQWGAIAKPFDCNAVSLQSYQKYE